MKYAIIAIFLMTGKAYMEVDGINLHHCPGKIAMIRMNTKEVEERIKPTKGEIRYKCLPEHEARLIVLASR